MACATALSGGPESQPVKGALGILMLDTRFPRIVGDIGNPNSFDYPVIFRRMEGLGPNDAVAAHPDRPHVLSVLVENANALIEAGAIGLSTSCGFLALYQEELAAALPVPVATSALLHIRRLAGRRVGVLTASARNLTPAHFSAVGAPADTPFAGLPEDSSFARTFIGNAATLDSDAVEQEVVAAALGLVERHPAVDTLVFECTNLPPYRRAVERATGRPVLDILDLLRDFYAGLAGSNRR